MKILLWAVIGFLTGGFVGYQGGVFVFCFVLNWGNLCGLFAVFGTGPLGALVGAAVGFEWARRHGK